MKTSRTSAAKSRAITTNRAKQPKAYSDIPEGCVLFGPRNARFLYLATAYWQFRTLCIWSLTKLLQIRLKSSFSYVYRTIIYVHAINHRQNLNFSKLFRLEDDKKVSKTRQTVLRKSNSTQNVRDFTLFSFFMLYRMSAKSNLLPKMTHFSLNIPW